eukprot:CAMPEP_0184013670 /NCGR_PEP_ID=MMETSP0954-20121128/5156_1 /TAXON_ID=627963 /ORGANISM="Aplanochytrium sp, Strain PBS07" /LENGTH=337 /DNA_ID=CAMNT_0026293913 /DNA_START=440 /DNA_END=1453 /DNA_ORIENTATION=+
MFTIWMVVVTTFDQDGAYEVMELVCPEDYGCTSFFSFGLYRHDKGACSAPFDECDEADLDARSGYDPVELKFDLGVYADEPTSETVSYVTEFPFKTGSSSATAEECECPDYNPLGYCEGWVGCNDDIDDAVITTTCVDTDAGFCVNWTIESDSAKKFWSASCIANQTGNTSSFACEEFTVRYFYPNVLLAVLLTTMVLLPFSTVLIVQIKTQLKKIIKCKDPIVIKHSQGAGPGQPLHEYSGAQGTYYEQDVERASKSRTCSRLDILLFITMVPLIIFTIWLIVRSAGRVGILLVVFLFLGQLLLQCILFACFKVGQLRRIKNMKERNGDPEYREYN